MTYSAAELRSEARRWRDARMEQRYAMIAPKPAPSPPPPIERTLVGALHADISVDPELRDAYERDYRREKALAEIKAAMAVDTNAVERNAPRALRSMAVGQLLNRS